jgi:methyl-accepting chemotaxis protein
MSVEQLADTQKQIIAKLNDHTRLVKAVIAKLNEHTATIKELKAQATQVKSVNVAATETAEASING